MSWVYKYLENGEDRYIGIVNSDDLCALQRRIDAHSKADGFPSHWIVLYAFVPTKTDAELLESHLIAISANKDKLLNKAKISWGPFTVGAIKSITWSVWGDVELRRSLLEEIYNIRLSLGWRGWNAVLPRLRDLSDPELSDLCKQFSSYRDAYLNHGKHKDKKDVFRYAAG